MRRLLQGSSVADLAHSYGAAFRRGVLSDHVGLLGVDAHVHVSVSGARTYVTDATGTEPVLCSDLVQLYDEDGPYDGRCGDFATDEGACAGHAAERARWMSMSEIDRYAVEYEEARV